MLFGSTKVNLTKTEFNLLAFLINNIDKLLKIIDSSQKVRAINILLERHKKQGTDLYQSPNDKGFVDNYLQDIIYVRNNLAHCSPHFRINIMGLL